MPNVPPFTPGMLKPGPDPLVRIRFFISRPITRTNQGGVIGAPLNAYSPQTARWLIACPSDQWIEVEALVPDLDGVHLWSRGELRAWSCRRGHQWVGHVHLEQAPLGAGVAMVPARLIRQSCSATIGPVARVG